MLWTSAISRQTGLSRALDELSSELERGLDGASAQLLVVFASPPHGEGVEQLARELSRRHPDAVLVGCTGAGVIGGGVEAEDSVALAVGAAHLPDVGLMPFHLEPGDADDLAQRPEQWRGLLGLEPEHQPVFVLLDDPFSSDATTVVAGLDQAFEGSPVVGGLASGGRAPREHVLLCGEEVHRSGTVGLALWGDIRMDTVVAQGSRPVGEPMLITRCAGGIVHSLDHDSAVARLEAVLTGMDHYERELFRRVPLIGLAVDEGEQPGRGDFLVRNLVGLDRATGTLGVGGMPREGMVARFHVRDAAAAADELAGLLVGYQHTHSGPPAGGLLFSCLGRGQRFFGRANHDSDMIRDQLGAVPMVGFFGNGELGPVHGRTFLHGYTSVAGLFRPRGWS